MINQKYAYRINKTAFLDQQTRKAKLWDETVDFKNAALLNEIIEKIDWPSIPKVGKTACWNAWLIVQHADIEFIEYSLNLMKSLPANEVAADNIKYLKDRVLTFHFWVQIHGTQFKKDFE